MVSLRSYWFNYYCADVFPFGFLTFDKLGNNIEASLLLSSVFVLKVT